MADIQDTNIPASSQSTPQTVSPVNVTGGLMLNSDVQNPISNPIQTVTADANVVQEAVANSIQSATNFNPVKMTNWISTKNNQTPYGGLPLSLGQERQLSASVFNDIPVQNAFQEYIIDVDEAYTKLNDGSYMPRYKNYIKGTDNENRLALEQGTWEKWGNGIAKFLGKTLVNTVGGTIGVVNGIVQVISDKKFESLYNNDFYKSLDDLNTYMDNSLPNYWTQESRNSGLLTQMGTANFWAEDFLGGLSFLTGTLLSETAWAAATGGTSLATTGARWGLRSAGTAAKVGRSTAVLERAARMYGRSYTSILKGYERANTLAKAGRVANTARFAVTSPMYEASMEARDNLREATDAFIQRTEYLYGRQPTQEEMREFMDTAVTSSNWLFGANWVLVGGSNFVTIGQYFGIKSTFSNSLSKSINKNLFGKGVRTTFDKAGNPIYQAIKPNKVQRVLATGFNITKVPLVEGVWEEGQQGVFRAASQNWLENKFSPIHTKENYTQIQSFVDGLGEAYGTTQGQKEVLLGILIGLVGAGGHKTVGADGRAQYNLAGIRTDVLERERLNKQVEARNEMMTGENSPVNVTESIRSTLNKISRMNQINASLADSDTQAQAGRLTDSAVSAETATFTQMLMQDESGWFNDAIDDFNTMIDVADLNELLPDNNLSTEQKDQLKAQLKQIYKRDSEHYKAAMKSAQAINPVAKNSQELYNDYTAELALNIYQARKAEERVFDYADVIEELTSKPGLSDALKSISNIDTVTKDLANQHTDLQNQIDEANDTLGRINQELPFVESTGINEAEATKNATRKAELYSERETLVKRILDIENQQKQLEDTYKKTAGTSLFLENNFGINKQQRSIQQIASSIQEVSGVTDFINALRQNKSVESELISNLEFLLNEYVGNAKALNTFINVTQRMSDPKFAETKLRSIPAKFVDRLSRLEEKGLQFDVDMVTILDNTNLSENEKFTLLTLAQLESGIDVTDNSTQTITEETPSTQESLAEEAVPTSLDPAVRDNLVTKLLNKETLTNEELAIYNANKKEIRQAAAQTRRTNGTTIGGIPYVRTENKQDTLKDAIDNSFNSILLSQENNPNENIQNLKPTEAEIEEFLSLDSKYRAGDFDGSNLSQNASDELQRYVDLRDKLNKFGNLVGTRISDDISVADAMVMLSQFTDNQNITVTASQTTEDVSMMQRTLPFDEGTESKSGSEMLMQTWDKVTMKPVSNVVLFKNQTIENGVVFQGLTIKGFLSRFPNVVDVVNTSKLESVDIDTYRQEPGDVLQVEFDNGQEMTIYITDLSNPMIDRAESAIFVENSDLQLEYLGDFWMNYKTVLDKNSRPINSDYQEESGEPFDIKAIYELRPGDNISMSVNVNHPYNSFLINQFNRSAKDEAAYNKLRDNLVIEGRNGAGALVSLHKSYRQSNAPSDAKARLESLRNKVANEVLERLGNSTAVKPSVLQFWHGGLPTDFSINDLDVFRPAEKQQKKGRNYAGFYMYDVTQRAEAETYSNQTGRGLHRFDIKPEARILKLGNIERISKSKLQEYLSQGYDVLQGIDVRGRTEYVLLNKDAVTNVVNETSATAALESQLEQTNSEIKTLVNERAQVVRDLDNTQMYEPKTETSQFLGYTSLPNEFNEFDAAKESISPEKAVFRVFELSDGTIEMALDSRGMRLSTKRRVFNQQAFFVDPFYEVVGDVQADSDFVTIKPAIVKRDGKKLVLQSRGQITVSDMELDYATVTAPIDTRLADLREKVRILHGEISDIENRTVTAAQPIITNPDIDPIINLDDSVVISEVLPGRANVIVQDGQIVFIPLTEDSRSKVLDLGFIEKGKLKLKQGLSGVRTFPYVKHITDGAEYRDKRMPIVVVEIAGNKYAYPANFSQNQFELVPTIESIMADDNISLSDKIITINDIIIGSGLSIQEYGLSPLDITQESYNEMLNKLNDAVVKEDISIFVSNPDVTMGNIMDRMTLNIDLSNNPFHSPKLRVTMPNTAAQPVVRDDKSLSQESKNNIQEENNKPC